MKEIDWGYFARQFKSPAIIHRQIVRGDLRTNLRALAAHMPKHGMQAILHTAVLGNVSSANERRAFAQTVRDLDVVRISYSFCICSDSMLIVENLHSH